MDNAGKIYVTGVCKNNSLVEYHTLEYSNSGVQQWVHKLPLNLTGTRIINKVAIDTWDMIYVCGEINGTTSRDFVLYQLNGNGGQQWVETYNGLINGDDAINDMVVDNLGHIFVTGQTQNGGGKFDFTTIKYSQSLVFFPPDFNNESAGNIIFNENKGQLVNTNNQLIPEQRFYSTSSSPALYLSNTKLSYVFSKIDTIKNNIDTLHRIDMSFVKGNPNTKAYPFSITDGSLNYFLPQCPQGITNVKGYKRVLVPNIYPNIDLHYYSNSKGLKYYFVVKPGGNPKDINIQFDGATSLGISQAGHLKINSSIGFIEQDKTQAYQVNFAQNIVPVTWNADWILSGSNSVRFNIGNYNTSLPLILQVDLGSSPLLSPSAADNIKWSTFFGGDLWDDPRSIRVSADGKKAIIGSYQSNIFPFTPNLTLTGDFTNYDVLFSVFDQDNKRKSTVIIGGSDTENGNDIVFGNNNNVFITGATLSSDFTTEQNTFYSSNLNNSTLSGSNDWFIAEYDFQYNTLNWSTYFGGPLGDNGEKILFDNNNNLFVIGSAHEGFPSINLSGATNLTYSGPYLFNTYILKINQSGQATWGTYYWGAGQVFPYSATIDKNNNLYIVGEATGNLTQSNNPSGAWVRPYKGNYDGFIIRYNSQGQITWATCLGGNDTEQMEGSAMVAVDNYDNIILTGTTISTNFPTINSNNYPTYNLTLNGESDGFIMQFNSNFDLKWSTYLGGNNIDWLNSIALVGDNILLTGMSISSDINVVQPANTYSQSQANNTYDATITCLNASRQIIWSTYFGGGSSNVNATDWGKCLAVYNNSLFMSGTTESSNLDTDYVFFPVKDYGNNAYYQDVNSGSADGFISMFDLSSVLSVTDLESEKSNLFGIYPNPVADRINISFNNRLRSDVDIYLYDISGKLAISKKIKNLIGEHVVNVDISNLPRGVYNIQLITNETTSTKKLIKL